MLSLRSVLGLAVLSVVLTGCFGGKSSDARCNDVEEYQLARSVPLVVVPDGLQAPTRGTGYAVPPPGDNPEVDGAACLARPPDYFKTPAAIPAALPSAPPPSTPGPLPEAGK